MPKFHMFVSHMGPNIITQKRLSDHRLILFVDRPSHNSLPLSASAIRSTQRGAATWGRGHVGGARPLRWRPPSEGCGGAVCRGRGGEREMLRPYLSSSAGTEEAGAALTVLWRSQSLTGIRSNNTPVWRQSAWQGKKKWEGKKKKLVFWPVNLFFYAFLEKRGEVS